MQIWAVGMVRNEADIIRINVLHHLSQGVDRFLILDNGSSDGTVDILSELSRSHPLEWRLAAGPYRQHHLVTGLARAAFIQGADWVVPIDADEFWYAPGSSIREVLASTDAGALRAQVVNFVQRRDQQTTTSDALLHMTRRVARPAGPVERIAELVESEEVSYVGIQYTPKWIGRASARLEIGIGHHYLVNIEDHRSRDTADIVCLHAPLRSRDVFLQKLDLGRPTEEVSENLKLAWHLRRWRRLAAQGRLDAEWRANSYAEDALDVHGRAQPLVRDFRLRDVVARWLPMGLRSPEPPVRSVPVATLESGPAADQSAGTSERPPTRARLRGTARAGIWGLSIVRNEVDIIATTVLYHLAVGFDRIVILDNGSSDGTTEVLDLLARDPRVRWTRSDGPFRQAELLGALVSQAYTEFASWVVPFDADEFWYPVGGDLRGVLDATSAAALGCRVVNFVQRRDEQQATVDSLRHMVMRPRRPVGPVACVEGLVNAREIAFVEGLYPPKWISRASSSVVISQGNHAVWGGEGDLARTEAIVCLHAPLRARSILRKQVEYGRRLDEVKLEPGEVWHVRRWRRLHDAEGLEREWLANSHVDGQLDVYGVDHPLVSDTRLQDAVAPWIDAARSLAAPRMAGASGIPEGSVAPAPRRDR
jgi:glycosyltransferase involved in cell wall biosynthesis